MSIRANLDLKFYLDLKFDADIRLISHTLVETSANSLFILVLYLTDRFDVFVFLYIFSIIKNIYIFVEIYIKFLFDDFQTLPKSTTKKPPKRS